VEILRVLITGLLSSEMRRKQQDKIIAAYEAIKI